MFLECGRACIKYLKEVCKKSFRTNISKLYWHKIKLRETLRKIKDKTIFKKRDKKDARHNNLFHL